jgi:hypothetical protein
MASSDPWNIGRRGIRQTVAADDIDRILRGRPGLLLGPGITMGAGCLTDLTRALGGSFEGPPDTEFLVMTDALVSKGIDRHDIRYRIRDWIQGMKPNAELGVIINARWRAVLSS